MNRDQADRMMQLEREKLWNSYLVEKMLGNADRAREIYKRIKDLTRWIERNKIPDAMPIGMHPAITEE